MGYFPRENFFLVEIAKNGSRSLCNRAITEWGDSSIMPGHYSIREICDYYPTGVKKGGTALALIRDPLDRMVSGANHMWANKADADLRLYDRLDQVLDGGQFKTWHVFRPQVAYLDHDKSYNITLVLFPFEDIDKAIEFMGSPETVHKNPGKHKISKKQILNYPRIDEFMGIYEEDYKLREKVLNGDYLPPTG